MTHYSRVRRLLLFLPLPLCPLASLSVHASPTLDWHIALANAFQKRFRSELDALLFIGPSKKRRVFPSASTREPAYILSDAPALPPIPSTSSFEPFSPLALLGRLRTFHPSLYSPSYPLSISPRALASAGWICPDSRDTLACGSCGARWGVAGLGDIADVRIRDEIGRRLAGTLNGRHREGCGWRIVSSPCTFLFSPYVSVCLSVHAALTGAIANLLDRLRTMLHPPLTSNIASLALRLHSVPAELSLVPTLSEKQLAHLVSAVARYITDQDQPSSTAIQLALFGWAPHELSTEILCCRICQRRIGLWSHLPGQGRELDPVGEHVEWCPIRSASWWSNCPLVKGGRADTKAVRVSQGVKNPKWLK